MTQPEHSEVSRQLMSIALDLPAGWAVSIEPSGQLRLLPPLGSDLRLKGDRGLARPPFDGRADELELSAGLAPPL